MSIKKSTFSSYKATQGIYLLLSSISTFHRLAGFSLRVFAVAFLLMAITLPGWAQTNPTAQPLPYSQDFSSLLHTSTTYPAGWQGWQLATSPSATFRTTAPTGDRALVASSSASTNSGNEHNYNGKVGFLNSGSLDLSIIVAINTTSASNVQVAYDIMTIRNPYNGTSDTRINEATLQYRIGTSGDFTTLTGIEYQNNTTTQTGTGITTPQNLQTKTIALPPTCNNQAVVQLRWLAREISGAGSRPSFAIDNFSAGAVIPPDYTITTTGNAIVITDISGNGETLDVSQSGGNIQFVVTPATRTYSINGGASTAFTTPASVALAGATSITINTAAGSDIINVGAFATNLPSLTINGGTGDDAVIFNGDITFIANANLDVDLQNDDATPGDDLVALATNANLILSGTGSATIKVSGYVQLDSGASIETVNGNLTVEANQQATPTPGSFYGILINGGALKTSGSGTLTVKGRGGSDAGGGQKGIYVLNSGQISGGNSGAVLVTGTGGPSAGNFNDGVFVDANGIITSLGGNVSVTGLGNGTGSSETHFGVFVRSGGMITAGGAGSVTVLGTGGATAGSNNRGVVVFLTNARITSSGGNVSVTGQGGGIGSSGENWGVYMLSAGEITAGGSGSVTVHGTGGASSGIGNYGVFIENTNTRITSSGGAVSVTGTGGGAGTSALNYGVYVFNGAVITSAGTGSGATVTVLGQGGSGTGGSNDGVLVNGTNARISSSGGAVSVTGTGGGAGASALNYGTYVLNGGMITSAGTGSGATVTVVGQGGNATGGNNYGVFVNGTNARISSSGGAVSVTGTGIGSAADILMQSAGAITTTSTSAGITLNSTTNGTWPNTSGTDVSTTSTQKTTFGIGSKLNIDIDGLAVNTLYQQLGVVGMIDLNGANLTFAGSIYSPALGNTFTIVNNDGTDPVIGTFNGLPQGATISNFLGSGLDASISYTGGTGNDVVLTVVNSIVCYADVDGDGFGDPNNSMMFSGSCGMGFVSNNTDCNDNNALEKPGQVWYKDTDNDGYAETGAATITQCLRPVGYKAAIELTSTTGDCNDNAAAINPAATEICDGIDNNCNSMTDEGVQTTYYADADGDGFGNPAVSQMACTQPMGYVTNNTDCNDNNALEKPGQVWYKDTDNDGYAETGAMTITQCLRPVGYKAASELTATTGDCNDNAAAINPAATEICDGIDNNCNSMTDEGVQTTYYADADGDGFGNPAVTQMACTAPMGYVVNNTDCDDNDALEKLGQVWYKDTDGDNYAETGAAIITQCLRPVGYKAASELTSTTGDCNDNNAAINPAATEVCDGVDNNCDGQTDEPQAIGGAWSSNDVGTGVNGSSGIGCSNGSSVYNVSASGFSTSSSDKLHLVSQQLCGNGEIIARVLDVSSGGWAGVTLRESLMPGSKKVALKTQLSSIIRREIRTATNGPASILNFNRPQHVWLRLTRNGGNFVGYTSIDGQNWSFAFSANVPMTGCIYAGIFAESINTNVTTTASFDNVSIGGAPALGSTAQNFTPSLDGLTVSVYPNPSSGDVTLSVQSATDRNLSLKVMDAFGRIVRDIELQEGSAFTYPLDLSKEPAGVYYLRLRSEDGVENVQRIVLQR